MQESKVKAEKSCVLLPNFMNMTMSSTEKKPVQFPDSVDILMQGNESIQVKGKKGELRLDLISEVAVNIQESSLNVQSTSNSKFSKAAAGTYRSLINNAIIGTYKGYEKTLELVGVGFRAALKGKQLNLQLGFSHDINFDIPEGIKIDVQKQTTIKISGFDKQKVGMIVSKIKSLRLPEPYKGKGVKYKDEIVLRKEGKKK